MRCRRLLLSVRLFLLVALLILSNIATGGGAQPTNSGSVTVTDSAVVPRTVTILASGGNVVWTNRGSKRHKIISAHRAFTDFELAPAEAQRVAFLSAGVYPYTVDGVTNGTVIVLSGAPPVGAPPGASSTPGPRRHTWQGTIHATATYRTHVPCEPGNRRCVNGWVRGGPYTGTYDGTLGLAEDSNGLITGQGRVSASGCKFASLPPATHISFEVRGSVIEAEGALPAALSLHIIISSFQTDGKTCGFGYGMAENIPEAHPGDAVIPITAPGIAKGPWHGRAEFFTTASFKVDYQFELNCTDCRRSP
jgi:hypothetical protein